MQTAVIIFSKNRAMQLDATLRSFARHCQDPDQAQVHVLCKTTDPANAANYARLAIEHPGVCFMHETDFRSQLLALLQPVEFVLFIVDDTLFVRGFRVQEMIGHLNRNPDAVGFSLRLGRNTVYAYMQGRPQPLPAFEPIEGEVLKFDWTQATGDFGYPLEVSSSLYRQADLMPLLSGAPFKSPNHLESALARRARSLGAARPALLCYERSVAFCNPVNKVQTAYSGNAAGRTYQYAVDDLNRLFESGYRIDVARYDQWISNAAHQEVPLHFSPNTAEG